MTQEKLVGKVTHIYNNIQVAIVDLVRPLKIGETVHFKGPRDDFRQTITQMQFDHKDITSAKAGQQVGVKMQATVHENSEVLKD